jgi:hypothetical protein
MSCWYEINCESMSSQHSLLMPNVLLDQKIFDVCHWPYEKRKIFFSSCNKFSCLTRFSFAISRVEKSQYLKEPALFHCFSVDSCCGVVIARTFDHALCAQINVPYILESNTHPVFGDFLNEKKLVPDSNVHLSLNHPLPTGRLIE